MVRVGVEWTDVFPKDDPPCNNLDLHYSSGLAEGFLMAMRSNGHSDIFNWGNDDAWSSDFDHPDFGGDSLNWSDNVHFCYFAGHGGQFRYEGKLAYNIGFSSRHNPPNLAPCRSLSPQWKLGDKLLKWMAFDSCKLAVNSDPGDMVEIWAPPMQGVHLVLGFMNIQHVGPTVRNRRILFGLDICRGVPIANAWLNWGYIVVDKRLEPSVPIAVAAGATREEAIARRDGETLRWLWYDVESTRWLAWKWRG